MEPLVSIIIPVYNSEKYLSECIKTVLAQTYTNIEVLLIDDGSTDNSFELCKEFERIDKRVRVIHQENAGVSSARNTGIENAQGRYITFVDSDDIISHMYIQTLVNDLENAILVMCAYEKITSYEYTFANTTGKSKVKSAKTCAKRLLQGDFPVAVWGTLFLKEAVGDIRFMDGIRNNEDKEFLYHYLLNNEDGQVVITNKKLYGYYVREGSATHTKWNGSFDIVTVADRMHQLTMGKDPEWEQDAINNSIRARMTSLKWIIQDGDCSNEKNFAMNRLRKEILQYRYPSGAGVRTIVEYRSLELGMWAYRLLFLLYRLLYSEEARERNNKRIMQR